MRRTSLPAPGTPAKVSFGSAGWNRPDWINLVYPRKTKRSHNLEFLSRYVDLAEIQETFDHPLKPEIAGLYARMVATNPDFMFTALLGRAFTYDRNFDDVAATAWKQGLLPLLRARRLGAVIMQFPWAFRFNAENRDFLIRLRREFHEFPLAAEFRHDSWLYDEAITTLVNYRIGFVNVDQPVFFRAMPPDAVLTAGPAVVRLHGRGRPEAFREFDGTPPSDYLYNLDELIEWKPRLQRLALHAPRVLVSCTNSCRGAALVNALQLQEILGSHTLDAPGPLIARYPAELAAFRSVKPVQTQLLPAVAA